MNKLNVDTIKSHVTAAITAIPQNSLISCSEHISEFSEFWTANTLVDIVPELDADTYQKLSEWASKFWKNILSPKMFTPISGRYLFRMEFGAESTFATYAFCKYLYELATAENIDAELAKHENDENALLDGAMYWWESLSTNKTLRVIRNISSDIAKTLYLFSNKPYSDGLVEQLFATNTILSVNTSAGDVEEAININKAVKHCIRLMKTNEQVTAGTVASINSLLTIGITGKDLNISDAALAHYRRHLCEFPYFVNTADENQIANLLLKWIDCYNDYLSDEVSIDTRLVQAASLFMTFLYISPYTSNNMETAYLVLCLFLFQCNLPPILVFNDEDMMLMNAALRKCEEKDSEEYLVTEFNKALSKEFKTLWLSSK